MEQLSQLIKVYGPKITLIIIYGVGIIYLLKFIIEKLIENILSSKYSKMIVDYENTINRRTMAYKILLEKELEFYNIYFSYASTLVTDIQDVQYNYDKSIADKKYNESLRKYILKILELIPKLKRDSILYESYCDKRVRVEISNLIVMLQEDFTTQVDIMMGKVREKKKYQNDIHKMCNEIIMQLALVSNFIQTREKEMSEQ